VLVDQFDQLPQPRPVALPPGKAGQ
jgi:hypothetical protein